ncbi:hypothetical protein AALD74_16845, partial [Lachnospiraceae bacterium 48-21]
GCWFEPNSGSLKRPVDSSVCGLFISEDRREEILAGNILLTENVSLNSLMKYCRFIFDMVY